MEQIPDAPWIRDAELNGVGEDPPPVYCPVCGSPCQEVYSDRDGEIVGCDECISIWDAYDWRDRRGE